LKFWQLWVNVGREKKSGFFDDRFEADKCDWMKPNAIADFLGTELWVRESSAGRF
jgi:hypothetical protein